MEFRPTDIKWVKNVLRDGGRNWAFFEYGMEQNFTLTFSQRQKNSAEKIKAGEVILLYQKVGNSPRPYMSHLVTPINNELRENIDPARHFKWERDVIVIARADNAINSPISPFLNYIRVGYGHAGKIESLSDEHSSIEIQNEIWGRFENHLNPELNVTLDNLITEQTVDAEFSVIEGRDIVTLREHFRKERNPVIVGLVKSRALESGTLNCVCCNFDFYKVYGEIGYGFIECHHKIPIATGGIRETRVNDLALVCANCHRMLHQKKSNGTYHSVESLKKELNKLM